MLDHDPIGSQICNPDHDVQLNGLTSTVLIAIVSFGMLALALYDFRRLVQFWLR